MSLSAKGSDYPIRVGVIGIGRGASLAASANLAGMQLVALCDKWDEKLQEIGSQYADVTLYNDYDRFLEHDMDAVVLANYFNEHAPFAIKALRAGKHVMSETSCNFTLAEGVELCRTVEDTGLIYMLAENYPYTIFNQEMRRIYKTGELGDVRYAEGEYNHPVSPDLIADLVPTPDHWRTWVPGTFYSTHALAPLMYITERMPTKVNALAFTGSVETTESTGFVILCRMDNGAVFRLFGIIIAGHSNWYRIHGSHGAMEITRGPGYFGPQQVRVWHEPWDRPDGVSPDRVYTPDWPDHAELAAKTGHGGGDFWTDFHFAEAIRKGKQPFLDVYRGVTMSSVGILAERSVREDGAPMDVPDFRSESERKKYENDNWDL